MTQAADVPVAWRIAGGRRRYNAARRRTRDERRRLVKALLLATEYPCMWVFGRAARIARELGVHHSTIGRDLAAIRPALNLPDPCCDLHARERERAASWERFVREEAASRYELTTEEIEAATANPSALRTTWPISKRRW